MHTTVIDPGVRERYIAMKGGEHAFTALDPRRVAHLVIDMQDGFLREGALLEVPEAREIVDNVNALSAAVRRTGGANYFTTFTTTTRDEWPVYFGQFQSAEFSAAEVAAFQRGSDDHRLSPRIEVAEGDTVLDKTRFSAFTLGSSDLLERLRERGIDTVLVTGTLTDCCCNATARDAQQLGFRVIFLSDATAALSDVEHNAAINNLAAWYADIRTTADTIALLEQGV